MNDRDDPRIVFDAGAQVGLSSITCSFSLTWTRTSGSTTTSGSASGSGTFNRIPFVPQNISNDYAFPDFVPINGAYGDGGVAYFDTKFCIPRTGCNPFTQPFTNIFQGPQFLGQTECRFLFTAHFTSHSTYTDPGGGTSTVDAGNDFPVYVTLAFSTGGRVTFSFAFLKFLPPDLSGFDPGNVDFEGIFEGTGFDGAPLSGGYGDIVMTDPAKLIGLTGDVTFSTDATAATDLSTVIDDQHGNLTCSATFSLSSS